MEFTFCLIGGTGRSGTSILRQIFTGHPEVATAPEWRFAIDPDGLLDFHCGVTQGWSPYVYDLRVKRLEALLRAVAHDSPWRRFYRAARRLTERRGPFKLEPRYLGIRAADHCPSFDQLADDLLRKLVAFRYAGSWTGMRQFEKAEMLYAPPPDRAAIERLLGDFMRQVAACVLEHRGARHYVEKNTWNILWFDRLLELLPEGRLVHIHRDPRDVVASYTKQAWTPSDPALAARMYADIVRRWWDIRARVPEGTFIEIALESLVRDPRSALDEICRFWGIPWHDGLLATDLSRSHTGRWQKELTPDQQRAVHEILAEPLRVMGYER